MWVPKKLKYEDEIGKIVRVYYFKEEIIGLTWDRAFPLG